MCTTLLACFSVRLTCPEFAHQLLACLYDSGCLILMLMTRTLACTYFPPRLMGCHDALYCILLDP